MEYKTNVMRLLEKNKIPYQPHSYADTDAISGIEVANILNQNPEQVFKTLVTRAPSRKYYVFMVPVASELDLKKAASSVKEKSIEMIKAKELLPLTGYIHGGCSPIGMKKQFQTVIDCTAENFETILFSAGKIGYQVEANLENLKGLFPYYFADVITR
ncbi:Cys-tRNA(Pro) deacylase [Scatolibacter rhodanostii]|uniref:Cys-tRNA(Pro) deacylase n=1 Tax=Scatolibacter rhodanostii TaxID=2014781 RepID=UPI000C06839F|nr:Cys-tRNA(Pro) deacylase [Scatolibacter rhodanostii]